jgi:hypothetical protein
MVPANRPRLQLSTLPSSDHEWPWMPVPPLPQSKICKFACSASRPAATTQKHPTRHRQLATCCAPRLCLTRIRRPQQIREFYARIFLGRTAANSYCRQPDTLLSSSTRTRCLWLCEFSSLPYTDFFDGLEPGHALGMSAIRRRRWGRVHEYAGPYYAYALGRDTVVWFGNDVDQIKADPFFWIGSDLFLV